MKVKELKKLLENADDNLDILLSSSDHSYIQGRAEITDAEYAKNGHISEYWDEENMSSGSKKKKALVIT